MPSLITEAQIEDQTLALLENTFGYELLNCFTHNREDLNDGSGRTSKRQVILPERLHAMVRQLNPHVPDATINQALAPLINDLRQAQDLLSANYEIYQLIRDGISISYEDANQQPVRDRLILIDFNNIAANQFLAVSQLWIQGSLYYRRPDIVLYINGLPLVFIELKNSNVALHTAYSENLTNYKQDIPQLFLTNALCILSNAIETKIGSFNAEWSHFFNWLRVADERDKIDRHAIQAQAISLQLVIEGLCEKAKLLDYLENFIIYHNKQQKIIAQNHQFIGVNRAIESFNNRAALEGKLGVFWHTQGSGKSFSMVFYVRKILRKIGGNFTFLVITDRDDLDRQIYRTFLNTETVSANEAAQPANSAELRTFLSQQKRMVFSLIQKFGYDKTQAYPVLTLRDDIVVIVDEAHRSQYQALGDNMRQGLPNAQFLAFTGTPLLGKDRKTNTWFGNYVSEYNFQQSMDDGATVPLFYEKRVPEVLIQNDALNEEFYAILEDEQLNEAQQARLERQFASELQIIKRNDRLETIAQDIVYHLPRRGYLGKAMVISVDKFTAVTMYDKVQYHWKKAIHSLRGTIAASKDAALKAELKQQLDYMHQLEMAVVISEEAGENDKFQQAGLNIVPHRQRMQKLDAHGHDLEHNFKDPRHPLQVVFVCSMWLTGFDAPTVSTLYLDKPLKDHSLMQTIARANRVSAYTINNVSKLNGEIIDYYNVFRNMQQALQAYAQGSAGLSAMPVREKSELFRLYDHAIAEATLFCQNNGIAITELQAQIADRETQLDTFEQLALLNAAADRLLANDQRRKAFAVYHNTAAALYEACKPEIMHQSRRTMLQVFNYLRDMVDARLYKPDNSAINQRIGSLLDESIAVDDQRENVREQQASYQMIATSEAWDLSKLDFEQLSDSFKQAPFKHLQISDLRAFIEQKLASMLKTNHSRVDFVQRLQAIIDNYNAGGSTTDSYFKQLVEFTKDLKAETERHVREGLTESELEIFDILKQPTMSNVDEQKVKLAAKDLLERLRNQQPKVLITDWHKHQQSRMVVENTLEALLDKTLPDSYNPELFRAKSKEIYQLLIDRAVQGQQWAA
ncbi:type I restriction endonuclease subunit R [Herpetosiphon sp. NSE202]|uniref:type I restriction endonuclease subunit R n=1 Tax=Herpetosiphon sp. NSE202 TaxID=3351349 RepID=UPI003640532B